MSNYRSDVEFGEGRYSPIAVPVLAAWVVEKVIPVSRTIIPEPFNVFNHAGNMIVSLTAGLATSWLGGKVYQQTLERDSDSLSSAKRKTQAVMVATALFAGAVLNALSETKIGVSISGLHNTIDPLDFAYGTASAVAGAASWNVEGMPVEDLTHMRNRVKERTGPY